MSRGNTIAMECGFSHTTRYGIDRSGKVGYHVVSCLRVTCQCRFPKKSLARTIFLSLLLAVFGNAQYSSVMARSDRHVPTSAREGLSFPRPLNFGFN